MIDYSLDNITDDVEFKVYTIDAYLRWYFIIFSK